MKDEAIAAPEPGPEERSPVAARLGRDRDYRVDGVLHSYLGVTTLGLIEEPIHVLLRRAWRPHGGVQPRLTLVWDSDVPTTVTVMRTSPPRPGWMRAAES